MTTPAMRLGLERPAAEWTAARAERAGAPPSTARRVHRAADARRESVSGLPSEFAQS